VIILNIFSNLIKTGKFLFQKIFQSSNKIVKISGNNFLTFLEQYKGARRIILVVVLYINIHAFWVSQKLILMGIPINPEWNLYQLSWLGLLGVFLGFYTMSRVSEFKSNTPWSSPNNWGMENQKKVLETNTNTDKLEDNGYPLEEGETSNVNSKS
jgi:hypothetical protein